MVKWIGGGDYVVSGKRQRELMIQLGGLEPTHDILDIGCGCGRTAAALTKFLMAPGSYSGFDAEPEVIKWCRENIWSDAADFNFVWIPVYNGYYGKNGSIQCRNLVFPYVDESFDFVCLWSVFTHMVPPDVQSYLREITRVLRPGGTCFLTAFLVNEESSELIAQSKSSLAICNPYGDAYIAYVDNVEGAIGYEPDKLLQWAKTAGLELSGGPHYGSWCGRQNCFDYQDIIILSKS